MDHIYLPTKNESKALKIVQSAFYRNEVLFNDKLHCLAHPYLVKVYFKAKIEQPRKNRNYAVVITCDDKNKYFDELFESIKFDCQYKPIIINKLPEIDTNELFHIAVSLNCKAVQKNQDITCELKRLFILFNLVCLHKCFGRGDDDFDGMFQSTDMKFIMQTLFQQIRHRNGRTLLSVFVFIKLMKSNLLNSEKYDIVLRIINIFRASPKNKRFIAHIECEINKSKVNNVASILSELGSIE